MGQVSPSCAEMGKGQPGSAWGREIDKVCRRKKTSPTSVGGKGVWLSPNPVLWEEEGMAQPQFRCSGKGHVLVLRGKETVAQFQLAAWAWGLGIWEGRGWLY